MKRSPIWLAGTLLLALASEAVLGGGLGDERFVPSGEVVFFESAVKSKIAGLSQYAASPAPSLVVSAAQHPQVVKEFTWWMKQVVNPECLPQDGFVREHLQLLPADHRARLEDLAFLAYESATQKFMIVQTGGVGARLWLFVREESPLPQRNCAEASDVASRFFKLFIRESFRQWIPNFEMSKTEGVYVGTPTPAKGASSVNQARCFVSSADVSVSVQKALPNETRPGREPLPDKWFSWWSE